MNNYMPRIADKLIEEKLEAVGAVLIEGPKFCGKTTTGEQIAKSVLYMADPDTRERNIALATTNIKRLLTGDVPRLIDEWQIAPQLWDAIRFEVGQTDNFCLPAQPFLPTLQKYSILAQDVSDGSECGLCPYGNQVIQQVKLV